MAGALLLLVPAVDLFLTHDMPTDGRRSIDGYK